MYDLAIIGDGPAGYSCAMTARNRNLSTVILANESNESWLARAKQIDNYPGMEKVSGAKLLDSFSKQAINMGVEIKKGFVRQIMESNGNFMLLVGNEIVEARSVTIATGAAKPKLLDGEEELVGAGVSYCATCDALFYKAKDIAVISSTKSGISDANFLSDVVNSIDYFQLKKHETTGLKDKINIEMEIPISLSRNEKGITIKTKNSEKTYAGVFVFRSAVALSQLYPDLKTDGVFIETDRQMNTSVAGIFAAGDCTGKPLQIPKAVGEGNIAAISVAEYLSNIEK